LGDSKFALGDVIFSLAVQVRLSTEEEVNNISFAVVEGVVNSAFKGAWRETD